MLKKEKVNTVDLVALYIGGDYLAAAAEKDEGDVWDPDFWPRDMREGNCFSLVELEGVPEELAEQLCTMGSSDQEFSDGYEAANAAGNYIIQSVAYNSKGEEGSEDDVDLLGNPKEGAVKIAQKLYSFGNTALTIKTKVPEVIPGAKDRYVNAIMDDLNKQFKSFKSGSSDFAEQLDIYLHMLGEKYNLVVEQEDEDTYMFVHPSLMGGKEYVGPVTGGEEDVVMDKQAAKFNVGDEVKFWSNNNFLVGVIDDPGPGQGDVIIEDYDGNFYRMPEEKVKKIGSKQVGFPPEDENSLEWHEWAVQYCLYILEHNVFLDFEVSLLKGEETASNPYKQPQGMPPEIWREAYQMLKEKGGAIMYKDSITKEWKTGGVKKQACSFCKGAKEIDDGNRVYECPDCEGSGVMNKNATIDYAALGDMEDYSEEEQEKYSAEADRLGFMDSQIQNKMGVSDGGILRDTPSLWKQYAFMIKNKVKKQIPAPVYLWLEDNNFHSLNKVLDELGLFASQSNKTAILKQDGDKMKDLFDFGWGAGVLAAQKDWDTTKRLNYSKYYFPTQSDLKSAAGEFINSQSFWGKLEVIDKEQITQGFITGFKERIVLLESAGEPTIEKLPNVANRVAILKQKHNDKTDKEEWALVSHDGSKVLKWFGASKPSENVVKSEEKRINYFKHNGKNAGRSPVRMTFQITDMDDSHLREYNKKMFLPMTLPAIKDWLNSNFAMGSIIARNWVSEGGKRKQFEGLTFEATFYNPEPALSFLRKNGLEYDGDVVDLEPDKSIGGFPVLQAHWFNIFVDDKEMGPQEFIETYGGKKIADDKSDLPELAALLDAIEHEAAYLGLEDSPQNRRDITEAVKGDEEVGDKFTQQEVKYYVDQFFNETLPEQKKIRGQGKRTDKVLGKAAKQAQMPFDKRVDASVEDEASILVSLLEPLAKQVSSSAAVWPDIVVNQGIEIAQNFFREKDGYATPNNEEMYEIVTSGIDGGLGRVWHIMEQLFKKRMKSGVVKKSGLDLFRKNNFIRFNRDLIPSEGPLQKALQDLEIDCLDEEETNIWFNFVREELERLGINPTYTFENSHVKKANHEADPENIEAAFTDSFVDAKGKRVIIGDYLEPVSDAFYGGEVEGFTTDGGVLLSAPASTIVYDTTKFIIVGSKKQADHDADLSAREIIEDMIADYFKSLIEDTDELTPYEYVEDSWDSKGPELPNDWLDIVQELVTERDQTKISKQADKKETSAHLVVGCPAKVVGNPADKFYGQTGIIHTIKEDGCVGLIMGGKEYIERFPEDLADVAKQEFFEADEDDKGGKGAITENEDKLSGALKENPKEGVLSSEEPPFGHGKK